MNLNVIATKIAVIATAGSLSLVSAPNVQAQVAPAAKSSVAAKAGRSFTHSVKEIQTRWNESNIVKNLGLKITGTVVNKKTGVVEFKTTSFSYGGDEFVLKKFYGDYGNNGKISRLTVLAPLPQTKEEVFLFNAAAANLLEVVGEKVTGNESDYGDFLFSVFEKIEGRGHVSSGTHKNLKLEISYSEDGMIYIISAY